MEPFGFIKSNYESLCSNFENAFQHYPGGIHGTIGFGIMVRLCMLVHFLVPNSPAVRQDCLDSYTIRSLQASSGMVGLRWI